MDRAYDSGAGGGPVGDPRPEGSAKRGRWMRSATAAATTDPAPAGPRVPRKDGLPRSGGAGGSRGPESGGIKTPVSGPEGHGKRFVEPYQFDDDQRRLIDQALIDAGVDDASGRAIFIGAIAYDVALLAADLDAVAAEDQPEPPAAAPPPSAPPATPAAEQAPRPREADADSAARLARAANEAREKLAGLDTDGAAALIAALNASDPFARDHGPAYLSTLIGELGRIAAAAAGLAGVTGERHHPAAAATGTRTADSDAEAQAEAEAATPPRDGRRRRTPPQPPHPAAMAFVRDAARVYREAFDLQPTMRAADPFPRALAVIAKATGLPIPTRVATLKQALASDPDRRVGRT